MIDRERRRAWAEERRLARAGVSPAVAALLAPYAAGARHRSWRAQEAQEPQGGPGAARSRRDDTRPAPGS